MHEFLIMLGLPLVFVAVMGLIKALSHLDPEYTRYKHHHPGHWL